MLLTLFACNVGASVAARKYTLRDPDRPHPNANRFRRLPPRLHETGRVNT
jgi:hypothetical protein